MSLSGHKQHIGILPISGAVGYWIFVWQFVADPATVTSTQKMHQKRLEKRRQIGLVRNVVNRQFSDRNLLKTIKGKG